MKKLLFARRTYGYGGVEVILLDWLKRIDYSEYEVYVCSPTDVFSQRIADAGLRVRFVTLTESEVLKIYGRYQPEKGIIDLVNGSIWHYLPIWLRFLRSIKPDVVVFLDGDFFTSPLACVLAAYIVTKGNVSMTIHSPSRLQEPEKKRTKYRFGVPDFGLWWYPRVWWPLLPWKLRAKLTKRILTVNQSIQEKIVRIFGYPKNKMGVASHGVDTARFKPSLATRTQVRRDWGIPDNATVIASTSRLSWEKHVEQLVRVFDQLASRDDSVWLVIAGEGPRKDAVQNLIASSNHHQRIKMLGQVKEITPVLQAADVYVLASEFEGSPIALMEAMAAGLVCLVSNIAGIDEMVANGRDCFLMETSGEGIHAGLQNVLTLTPSERRQIGANARATVKEKFELEKGIQSTFAQLGFATHQTKLETASSESRLPKFMPAIDGLRAIAVLIVLLFHFPWLPVPRHVLLERLHLQPVTQYGWIGVDLFFVISGFLITGILLDSKGSPNYLWNFYARRALRIWPLYYAVLAFVFVIYPAVHPQGSAVELTKGWPYYVAYIQNFIYFDNGAPMLGHTWSLAVEEQFYITWPFVVLLCSRKRLQAIVVTLFLAAPLIRLGLSHVSYIGDEYPMVTFGRMDGILAGSLLALWFRSESFSAEKLRKVACALLLIGGAFSTYLLTTSGKGGHQSLTVYSFLAVAFCGLIGFAAVDSLLPRPIYALLTNPVGRYVGKISYGLYLIHPIAYYMYNFMIGALHSRLGEDSFRKDALAFVGEIGLVFLLASLSWYLFEQPLLKFKNKFTRNTKRSETYPVVHTRSVQTNG